MEEELDPTDPRFAPRAYRSATEFAAVAPTWEICPKYTFSQFQQEYARSPSRALCDFGSVPLFAEEAFFRDPEILDVRANHARQNAFVEDTVESSTSRDGYLVNILRPDFLPDGSFHYYVHCDTSKNHDATAFALAHWDRHAKVELPGAEPVVGRVVVDGMVRVLARPSEDINYEGIRELLYALKERGFYLRLITFDKFNTIELIQKLQRRGYWAEEFSVDRTSLTVYGTLQSLMLQHKLDYYPHPVFLHECRRLQIKNGTKVDHPSKPGASKDVSDAVAAAVYHACLSAGAEVYASSQSMSPEQVRAVDEDTARREELLGFRENETIW